MHTYVRICTHVVSMWSLVLHAKVLCFRLIFRMNAKSCYYHQDSRFPAIAFHNKWVGVPVWTEPFKNREQQMRLSKPKQLESFVCIVWRSFWLKVGHRQKLNRLTVVTTSQSFDYLCNVAKKEKKVMSPASGSVKSINSGSYGAASHVKLSIFHWNLYFFRVAANFIAKLSQSDRFSLAPLCAPFFCKLFS